MELHKSCWESVLGEASAVLSESNSIIYRNCFNSHSAKRVYNLLFLYNVSNKLKYCLSKVYLTVHGKSFENSEFNFSRAELDNLDDSDLLDYTIGKLDFWRSAFEELKIALGQRTLSDLEYQIETRSRNLDLVVSRCLRSDWLVKEGGRT